MAGPGRTGVRIRSRVSLADAALMRLEAKMAKGASLKDAETNPDLNAATISSVSSPVADATPIAPEAIAAEQPRPEAAAAAIAAELEAALKGHMATVAAALAARELQIAPEAPVEPAIAIPPAPPKQGDARSIYAPDPHLKAARIDLRLPPVAPLKMEPLRKAEPLPPPRVAAPPPRAAALPPAAAPELQDEWPADDGAFAALDWLAPADELPPRRPMKRARPLGHLPPIVDRRDGVGARTLAIAALFGLAVGIGAIAAYQFALAPAAPPVVATAPSLPMVDTTKVVKIEADRVPQNVSQPLAKVASMAATPVDAPAIADAGPLAVAQPPAAAAAAEPQPAAIAPAGAGSRSLADVGAPAIAPPEMRPTEDAVTAMDEPAADAPADEIAASASADQADTADHPALAYAAPSEPSDPVARSFFGKGDDGAADDNPPPKKSRPSKGGVAAGRAKVITHVNMRAKPDNAAPAVKVLAAGSTVQVVRCDFWCEVVSDGKHGYVFRRFLDN